MEQKLKSFLKSNLLLNSILLLILFVSAYYMEQHFTIGHDWGGDFALYLDQAQALVNGELNELYQKNKFTVDYSSRLQGPYLYPMGYPILISPVVGLLGLNFYLLKIFTSLFFFCGLAIVYKLFVSYLKDLLLPFIIVGLIAFNDNYLFHGDQLLSDFPFFFFTFLVFFLFKSEMSNSRQLLLGFVIFYAFLIRDLGILLLASLFIYQLSRSSIKEILKSQWKTYLVFALLALSSFFIFPFGSQNHYELFIKEISWNTISSNWKYYLSIYEIFFRGAEDKLWLLYSISILFVLGVILSAKKHIHLFVFFALSSCILLLWPYNQSIRFLFPIIPIVLFFILYPLSQLARRIKLLLVYPALIFFSYFYFQKSLDLNQQNLKLETNQVLKEENIELYKFVSKHYPESDTIVFFKPRVLRMFTGVNSLYLEPNKFSSSTYKHLIIYKPWTNNDGLDGLNLEKEFSNFAVYSK